MRGYAKITCVSILMMGLLAVPNLSPADRWEWAAPAVEYGAAVKNRTAS